MNNTFIKRIKIFIISALVLIVAGMAMFGFLGFNQTVDNGNSYEMQISVNQVAGDAVQVLKDSSKKAIKDNGLDIVDCQVLDEGGTIIYKFSSDVTEKAQAIKTAVQDALVADSGVSNIEAEVSVYKVKAGYSTHVLNVVLSLGIGIIVASLFVAILNKFASGLAVFGAGILSTILYFALVGLTRIPAMPYFGVFIALSMILSVATSTLITTKYREMTKNDAKADKKEVICKTNSALKVLFVLVSIAVLLMSGIFAITNSVWVGLIMLVAGASGILSAVYFTPVLWAWLKK